MSKQCDEEGYNDDPNEYLDDHVDREGATWLFIAFLFLGIVWGLVVGLGGKQ